MAILKAITIICWVIFILYWAIGARSVKPTQETKLSVGGFWWNIGRIFIILLLFLSFGFPISIFPFRVSLFPYSAAMAIISVILVILGLLVAISARKTLAGNWSRDAVYKREHELITTGLYGYVRHPIYSGVLLMFLGTALVMRTVSASLLFLILLFVFVFRLRSEEELLTKYFPREYPEYKKRVKALIPFVW